MKVTTWNPELQIEKEITKKMVQMRCAEEGQCSMFWDLFVGWGEGLGVNLFQTPY